MKKRKNMFLTVLRIIGTVAAALYIAFLIGERAPLFNNVTFADISVYLLFLVFVAGYVFLWLNEIVSGIILLVWHGLQWVLVIWVWIDGGMTIFFGVPLAIFGLIVLPYGISSRRTSESPWFRPAATPNNKFPHVRSVW